MTYELSGISLGYKDKIVLKDINLNITKGEICIMIGANGCGKSTLLKSMARILQPWTGTVHLNEKDIHSSSTKEIARLLSFMPQSPFAPDDLTVFNLVKQGRYPYQNIFHQWTEEDERIVQSALAITELSDIAQKAFGQLSGGQKQRVWIAMILAQDTDVILLDEPTNHLDIKYRIEILDLLKKLNRDEGRTIILVLHDINLACRYAHNLIALKDGDIFASGKPEDIVKEDLISQVFGIQSKIVPCPVFHSPLCIPYH